MFSDCKESVAISGVIVPLPRTCAKSRTRRSNELQIRGVPRERLEISTAASSMIGTFSNCAERLMILCSVSGS